MSLQVWLPLISDIHNQGLLNKTFTSNNITWSAGKLGNCATFSSTNNSNVYTDGVTIGNTWTVCCWAKAATDHSGYIAQLGNAGTSSQVQFGFRTVSGATNQILTIINKSSKSFELSGYVSTNWNHIALSFDGSTRKIYINGVFGGEYTETATYYEGNRLSVGRYYSSSSFNGQIQDFRLYDNVLTQEEIKKISRGLVVHYTLDRFGCDNLIPDSYSRNSANWHNGSRVTIDAEESAGGMTVAKITGSSSDWNAVARTHQNATRLMPYSSVQNKTVTFSCWMKGNSSFNQGITFALRTSSSTSRTKYFTGGTFALTTEWKRYSFTITLTDGLFVSGSGTISSTDYFFIEVYNHVDGQIVWTKGWKLELSDKATPWVPNSGDAEYAKLGLNNNVEYDISGYGYNLSKFGNANVSYTSNTPRYRIATSVGTASNSGYSLSAATQGGTSVATLSAWVYETARSDGDRDLVINNGRYITIKSTGVLSTYAYGKSPAGYHDGTTVIPLNTWTHLAVVWDDNYVYGYVNGVQDFKIACTGNFTSMANTYLLGEPNSTRTFHGYVSDVRFYSTAFSAADITALYQKRL